MESGFGRHDRPPTEHDLERLSLQQLTTPSWPLDAMVRGCRDAGVSSVGLFRTFVEPFGVERAAALLRAADIRVTSYSPVGFFAAGIDADGLRRGLDDNLRCLDEAVALGAELVVAVAGPLAPRDTNIAAARDRVREGLRELMPHLVARDLKLALEPLHPMMCPDRSVVCTLREALDIVEAFPAGRAGLSVDIYHAWWDPDLTSQLLRARDRIFLVQLSDWLVPVPQDRLSGRGLMGEGCIDLAGFLATLRRVGYAGAFEIEVLSRELAAAPGPLTLQRVIEAYRGCMATAPER